MTATATSLFGDLTFRELNGLRVRKRPILDNLSSDSGVYGAGVISVEHVGSPTPPLAASFAKVRRCHLLAISDEDGYVGFYDTWRKLPPFEYCREKAEKSRVCEWIAHDNAIFDICWIKDDTQMLTASGDQTIKIWDVDRRKCTGCLMGHSGSVKSLSLHSANPDLVVSGSRDGSFALWDLRCKSASSNSQGEARFAYNAIVKNAHSSKRKGIKRQKVPSMSITSVLYLKDQVSVAVAASVDSVVKFWDTRDLKSFSNQVCPIIDSCIEKEVHHGVSSLSQDTSGVFISASCMDNRIYLYDVLRLDKGPIKIFSGSKIESFYVKAAISPDGTHILSGSGDGNAYIWQVTRPDQPVALKGHEGEVTAVDWCSSEFGKIATSSDDLTVRVWNMKEGSSINACSPTSFRRRIMANPVTSVKKLIMDVPAKSTAEITPEKLLEFGTPESARKRKLGPICENYDLQKSPEASISPSSVLNPPPSLKRRTLRDYFLTTS